MRLPLNLSPMHQMVQGNLSRFGVMTHQLEITIQHLYMRGWAFQEELLSPRLLSYETRLLKLICITDTYLEGKKGSGQAYNLGLTRSQNPLFNGLFKASSSSSPSLLRSYKYKLDPFFQWSVIVEDYTSRGLRFPTDKLPALSGIASQVQQALGGDEYLAVLWKSHMPRALGWMVKSMNKLGKRNRALPEH